MSSKKGSLELSVNAIVILIIAITMLGLGLFFVNNTFRSVSKQFEEQVKQEPEPQTASSQNPITLSRDSLIVTLNEKVALKVGIANPSVNPWNNTGFVINCSGAGDEGAKVVSSPMFNKRNLDSGDSFVGQYLFTVGKPLSDTYLCVAKTTTTDLNNLTTDTGYSKDITIQVK